MRSIDARLSRSFSCSLVLRVRKSEYVLGECRRELPRRARPAPFVDATQDIRIALRNQLPHSLFLCPLSDVIFTLSSPSPSPLRFLYLLPFDLSNLKNDSSTCDAYECLVAMTLGILEICQRILQLNRNT